MGQPGVFSIYCWPFQTNNTMFTTNKCEKVKSIQYTALGFKTSTSQT